MSDPVVLPMFPLGTVLFPTQPLPLRIFEPRYRQMTHDLLAGDGRFGVVLIERGFEVGGGDVRSAIGTVAQVIQCQPFPDGRFALLAVGVERMRVIDWLADDPYPRASIETLTEAPAPAGTEAVLGERYREVGLLVRRALALASELGYRTPPAALELSDDPVAGSLQLCSIAPLGPFDRQRLLGADGTPARLDLLATLIDDACATFQAELGLGGPGTSAGE